MLSAFYSPKFTNIIAVFFPAIADIGQVLYLRSPTSTRWIMRRTDKYAHGSYG